MKQLKFKKAFYLIAFIGSIFGCQTEEIEAPNVELTEIESIQAQFSLEEFDNTFVKNNLQINWNDFLINPESKNHPAHYEFGTNITANNFIESGDKTLYFKYKVKAFKITKNYWRFEIIKFLTDDKKLLNTISNNTLLDNFSGTISHFDLSGNLIKVVGMEKGIAIKPSKSKNTTLKRIPVPTKAPLFDPGGGGSYLWIETEHYTDWYKVYSNGTFEYTHSVYNYSTWEYVYVPSYNSYNYTVYPYHNHLPNNGFGGGSNHKNENIVVEDDTKIINKLTGKAGCVYDKLKNNSVLSKTIEKFKGEKAPFHLIIDQKSNLKVDDNNPNSALVNGKTYYGDSYYVTMTLNTEQANNRPSLAVARTILHEAIHAEIYRKIKSFAPLTYDSAAKTWKLPNGSRAQFETLFDYYDKYPNNPHHDYIADYYRTAIEFGLGEYAKNIGETHPDQFYKDMAWSGLLDTKAWENQYADKAYADKEKARIKNTIINYEKSGINECN